MGARVLVICLLLLGGCGAEDFTPFGHNVTGLGRGHNQKAIAQIKEEVGSERFYRFAVISDIQNDYEALGEVVSRVNSIDPDFVLVAGDITDKGLLVEYEWSFEGLDDLDAPWVTVVGNHDALTHGKRIFEKAIGDFNEVFHVGNERFVLFNSNDYEFGRSLPDLSWLNRVLRRNLRKRTTLVSHVPVHVANIHSKKEVKTFRSLLKRHEPALYFSGHRHFSRKETVGATKTVIVPNVKKRRFALVKVSPSRFRIFDCDLRSCQSAFQEASL